MNRLKIRSQDENGVLMCVKIVITKTSCNNELILVDYIDGEKTFEIKDQQVRVAIYCGKLYLPVIKEVFFDEKKTAEITAVMKKIVDPAQYGLFSFDAHNHVSRKYYDKEKTIDLKKAVVIAKGEGLNGFFAGPPYDYENHKEAKTGTILNEAPYRKRYENLINSVNSCSFILDIGNEYCKYRYGHVFMINYDQLPPVNRFRDPMYYTYEQNRQNESETEPEFTNTPISNAIYENKGPNTAAVYAHPTSWWYEEGNKFITNIASTLGFDILTGAIDAVVIMGYKADQKYYRDVWFELLDNGYFVTGIAETDAVMDVENFEMPPFKTYAYIDELSPDGFGKAVKSGKCIVTSGPILHFTVDGYLPGAKLERVPGKKYKAEVLVHACYEAPLSRLEFIQNGKVLKEIRIEGQSTKVSLDITADEDGYILAVCYDEAGNLAISNPVYIRNNPFINVNYHSHVTVDVYQGEYPVTGVYKVGENGEESHFDGKVVCRIRPHEKIIIKVGDMEKVVELFYLEELQNIFKKLYSGGFNKDMKYNPGEVPAEAFEIVRVRKILDSVRIRVDFPEGSRKKARGVIYQDTHVDNSLVKENTYIGAGYINKEIPSLEDFIRHLPKPIWDGHESTLKCYNRAWEIAWSKLRKPEKDSGFVSNFLYTEFSNSIFMWGLSFVSQFGRYARKTFDFIGCLDNFYAKQHRDGFISRQINIFTGNDEFERFDPSSTGPNILAWTEWEDYKLSGNTERLEKVFPALVAYHRWLRKYRTWKDGTYFSSGWGCGMDNQPRMKSGYSPMFDHGHMSWIDITAQQILSAKSIVRIAKEIGREDEVEDMTDEALRLEKYINNYMWDEKESFYFDRYNDGSLSREKTIGAYWTLLADIVPKERLDAFVAHLNEGGCFYSLHRIPTIPVNSPYFVSDGGDYWRGGVWCITNYMVIKGLVKKGYKDLAHEIAKNHVEMVTKVFETTGSIWESYDALKPLPGKCYGKFVRNEFVGFSGLGPITIFLEEVIGIKPVASENMLVWNIKLTERHGVENYYFGSNGEVDLHCMPRKNVHEEPEIIAKSTKPVTIKVTWDGGEKILYLGN